MLAVQAFHLANEQLALTLSNFGASLLSCQVKMPNGNWREVVLGCTLADLPRQPSYLGMTIGRYANRIANSRFTLDGQDFPLSCNQAPHQLHGGKEGFSHRLWQVAKQTQDEITFALHSPTGDQGFPANVDVTATYRLHGNQLWVEYSAHSDDTTPLCLTNHAYFNLDGVTKNAVLDVRDHRLQLFAQKFLPVASDGIPNAPLKDVQGTSFDFRQGKTIRQDFGKEEQQATQGYDHSFLLDKTTENTCELAAILTNATGDLRLSVSTTQPAVQLYTGNFLQGTPSILSQPYGNFAGLALETQVLPDTPNHPEWQHYGSFLKAGETYHQQTCFAFEA